MTVTKMLDKKSAFITGSATGIGEGLVNKLQAEGWQVFAGYNSKHEQASWNGKPNVTAVKCNVTDLQDVTAAASLIGKSTGGRLDLLVNNAGYAGNCGVAESPNMDEYRKTFEVNFWGPLQMAQAFMPLLRKAQGRIINTTSASVYMTLPMGSAYPVSKTALKALTNHMRMEMAPFGVQVASLEPGGVDTPMVAFGDDVKAGQWNAIPEHLRDDYRRHFVDGASAVGDNFKFFSPPDFADRVYRQMICVPRMKLSYLIGPGVAPLPWLHRLLPSQQVQNIWAKMFARKV
ncbi:MAG TPA: SDR family NAD(P)-dependent oxidoreductase [Dongiaceae bacterium]|nr:SDR family NAD(P)-dependent oxidoreductase [Dongiaceae bacterium]